MEPIDPLILMMIRVAASAYGVETPMLAAIIHKESGFQIDKLGDFDKDGQPHAFGLGQLHDQGAGYGYPPELLLNPAFNVMITARYFTYLKGIYPNNIKLAISAYNQGPNGAAERGYGHNRQYVQTVLNLRNQYAEDLKKR